MVIRPTNYAPPTDPLHFADWAGEFMQRYSDVVHYWHCVG